MAKTKIKKNGSPDQKKLWQENRTLVSRFVTVISAKDYVPETKAPSKRDLHRMETGYNKYK